MPPSNDVPRSEAVEPPVRRSYGDFWALLVLVCVLLFFYWDFAAGRSYVWDDTLNEFYPGVNYFAKSIAAGRFPLWFPGVRDGSPFYSDTQLAVFYPLEWLLPLFVRAGRLPILVYQRYIFLHCLLGAVFAYTFLRALKLSPISALAGGLAFCLSGFFALRMNMHSVTIQVYIWLPLQLFFVHQFLRKGGQWRWLGLVGAVVMSLLGGFPQTTVYCWYLVIAYWLYRSYLRQRDRGRTWKSALTRCAMVEAPKLLGTFAVVFGIAAASLLPGLENWSHTGRPGRTFQDISDTSLTYQGLVRLFVPDFFGGVEKQRGGIVFWGADPRSPSVQQTASVVGTSDQSVQSSPGFWQYWDCNAYSGQIFWVALVLILSNWKGVRDKQVVGFFLTAWFMGLWFMLGRYGGLFHILYHVLPGVSSFRVPAKMSCVVTFAAAVVVAYLVELVWREGVKLRLWPALLLVVGYGGFIAALDFGGEHLMAELRDWDKLNLVRNETWYDAAIAVYSFAAISAACRIRQPMRAAGLFALLALSVADSYHSSGSFTVRESNPDEHYYRVIPGVARLMEARAQRGPFRYAQILDGKLVEEWVWPRNLPYFYDFLETPEGYTSYYVNGIREFQSITNQQAKIALQNIELAITRDPQLGVPTGASLDCLPRAKFFARVRRYKSRTTLLDALDRNEIDWHNETAVWGPVALGANREAERATPAGTNDEVRFVAGTPEAYTLVYNVSRPGVVFVSQAFYPGWIADGGKFKIVEVFGAFQGVVIPAAGRGEIRVVFSPQILKLAFVISSLSAVITVLVAIFVIRIRPSPVTDPP